ncbi:MAG: molybdopterin molybdotransferase MoeA [Ginsengibacter sp.]
MISVKEAKEKIAENVGLLQPKVLQLEQANGLVLAEPVSAKFDIPSFRQSSMDGYAFRFCDKKLPLEIQNRIAAGDSSSYSISEREAARIFTGAPLPENADTVVMQEKVSVKDDKVLIHDEHLKKGDFVRPIGSEIKAGQTALEKGTILKPASIGFLAAIGINEVCVYPYPLVTVIITGNELQPPGTQLSFGKVYDSNSYSLSAALKVAGIEKIKIAYAEDKPEAVEDILKTALDESDLVLLTGGVSVGDYDFVVQAAENCGITKHCHKIKQKPGKPLYFGTKDEKVIFGLPGNPGSVLTCFYEYVLLAIEKMTNKATALQKQKAILQNDYSKKAGLTHFLKGTCEEGKVKMLSSQASFQLRSFAIADCLVVVDEEAETLKEGDEVEVHLIPS